MDLLDRIDRELTSDSRNITILDNLLAEAKQEILYFHNLYPTNWNLIKREYDPLIGNMYIDQKGKEWKFFGLVDGESDYYYGMSCDGELLLLSCVGHIESFDFTPVTPGTSLLDDR